MSRSPNSAPWQEECGPGQPTLAAKAPTDPALPTQPLPQPPPALANDNLEDLQRQLDELQAAASSMREQLGVLDKKSVDQRLDREKIVSVMEQVTTDVVAVRKELDRHRDEVASVATLVYEQHAEKEDLLADVEQKLNELLSQYEN